MTHVETERLEEMLVWCQQRKDDKPWYGMGDDSPKMVTTCDFMMSLCTELLSLRSQQAPAGVVKGLEWEATGSRDWVADSVAGQYVLNRDELSAGGCYSLWVPGADDDDFAIFIDKSEAKAAAEADYRKRILSALEPQQEEAVIWRWRYNDPTKSEAKCGWFYGKEPPSDAIGRAWAGWECEPLYAHPTPVQKVPFGAFALGDRVTKTKGSSWTGRVVGYYTTELTPVGYAVESENEPGSVQFYPEAALTAALASHREGE